MCNVSLTSGARGDQASGSVGAHHDCTVPSHPANVSQAGVPRDCVATLARRWSTRAPSSE
ncbi:hypothetical protein DIE17_30310 [Burkholderia sp. Bp9099]|nr:hypothetical protein DIE17_30310 [Burkholderia sp. Bp9099]